MWVPDSSTVGRPDERREATREAAAHQRAHFFIVTTVAALYMLTIEQNVRNLHIARDYRHRQRQFAQLHMLQLADKRA